MPEISHSTKITLGLVLVAGGIIFNSGFFYATQGALAARVSTLEADRQKTMQMSEDIAVIKNTLATMDKSFGTILTKLDNSSK